MTPRSRRSIPRSARRPGTRRRPSSWRCSKSKPSSPAPSGRRCAGARPSPRRRPNPGRRRASRTIAARGSMRISRLLPLTLLLVSAPSCRAALSPQAEQALQAGLKDLYDLNYARSRADFHGLTVSEPNDPFGYLFEAGGIWWESSQEYGLFQDTPALEGLFEQDVQASIRTAQAWANAKDDDHKADGNFALGIALGTEGQWRLLRREWMRAYFEGKKAI